MGFIYDYSAKVFSEHGQPSTTACPQLEYTYIESVCTRAKLVCRSWETVLAVGQQWMQLHEARPLVAWRGDDYSNVESLNLLPWHLIGADLWTARSHCPSQPIVTMLQHETPRCWVTRVL